MKLLRVEKQAAYATSATMHHFSALVNTEYGSVGSSLVESSLHCLDIFNYRVSPLKLAKTLSSFRGTRGERENSRAPANGGRGKGVNLFITNQQPNCVANIPCLPHQ